MLLLIEFDLPKMGAFALSDKSIDYSLKPWAEGTKELLQHSFDLLSQESHSLRRIAFICIDNAVELMIKTYLTLPKRITNIQLSWSKIYERIESFPKMLDTLYEYAPDKFDGIDINEIEWFHRIRNDLYHNGHGFLIEKKYVVIYAEIARQLFENLFNHPLEVDSNEKNANQLLGSFIQEWVKLEKSIQKLSLTAHKYDKKEILIRPMTSMQLLYNLININKNPDIPIKIELEKIKKIDSFREIRNQIVHRAANHENLLNQKLIEETKELTSYIQQLMNQLHEKMEWKEKE